MRVKDNQYSFIIDGVHRPFPKEWTTEVIIQEFMYGAGLGATTNLFMYDKEDLKRIEEYNMEHPHRNKTPEIILDKGEVFICYKDINNSLFFIAQDRNYDRLFLVEVNKKNYKPLTRKSFHDWLMGN